MSATNNDIAEHKGTKTKKEATMIEVLPLYNRFYDAHGNSNRIS